MPEISKILRNYFPLVFSFAQGQHSRHCSFVPLGHRDDDTPSMPDVRSEYTHSVAKKTTGNQLMLSQSKAEGIWPTFVNIISTEAIPFHSVPL